MRVLFNTGVVWFGVVGERFTFGWQRFPPQGMKRSPLWRVTRGHLFTVYRLGPFMLTVYRFTDAELGRMGRAMLRDLDK